MILLLVVVLIWVATDIGGYLYPSYRYHRRSLAIFLKVYFIPLASAQFFLITYLSQYFYLRILTFL